MCGQVSGTWAVMAVKQSNPSTLSNNFYGTSRKAVKDVATLGRRCTTLGEENVQRNAHALPEFVDSIS
jgi:hypothetical protein